MEFHAVICCGRGINLSPFSKVKETGITKALLPIGNKPMIEYVLEWCDQAQFRAITVVTDSESHEGIHKVVELYSKKTRVNTGGQLSKINTSTFDGDSTGEILDLFIEKESSDFILLPCDFITDLPPQVLIEQYRNKDNSDIAMSVHYLNKFDSIDKKSLTHYYTVYSDDDHLLDIYSKDSVETNKFLELRAQMVWRSPTTKVSTKLLDSFIYFFSKEAFQALKKEVPDYKLKSATKILRDLARSSWKHSSRQGGISLFVLPQECDFIRSDNVAAYMEANRYMMKLKAQEQQQPPQAKEKGAATVGADSVVGENTVLGERTNVKKTVVGDNCTIGKRCRLTGCVLLDHVTLEDDVVLENCVIGRNATIHMKARLTNCNVEGSYTVSKGTQVKGETLTNIFVEGVMDDSDDSEDDSEDYDSYDDEYNDDEEDDGLFER
ncbi:hypothetical protein WICPIJ_008233 [Wickerhamomyces pijperi]|uniref:Translation initiation factor eIF2B subunit gamma n=1 Tax=Wickerhamomyces pijperi TaxID=599730 RepID=A0A9P8PYK4_WICPI|nr:hypothetical protein WICPIJ_008233 [Wickerhamomyces pijperi]